MKLSADNIRLKTKPWGVKNWLQGPETGLFSRQRSGEVKQPKNSSAVLKVTKPPSLWNRGSLERAGLFPVLAVSASTLMERAAPKNPKSSLTELQRGCMQMGQSSSTWTAPRWGWPATSSSRNPESLEDPCIPQELRSVYSGVVLAQ